MEEQQKVLYVETVFEHDGYIGYVVLRSRVWYRHGMLLLPPNHPVKGQITYESIGEVGGKERFIHRLRNPEIGVHGGISEVHIIAPHSVPRYNEVYEQEIIPKEGGILLGFDCNHLWDAADLDAAHEHGASAEEIDNLLRFRGLESRVHSARGVEFLVKELAEQLKELEKHHG